MTALREAAYLRSRGLCEHCGRPLPERWELHHRRPGGMGGTKRRGQQELSNVLALRHECHNMTPESVHALGPRHDGGWLVSTHESDPASVPVRLWGREPVLLDDAGGWSRLPPPEPVAEQALPAAKPAPDPHTPATRLGSYVGRVG